MHVLVICASAAVVAWLCWLAVVDQRTGRIPNRLVLPAVAGTVVVAVLVPAVGWSALMLAVPYLIAFASSAGGGGDVKLALPCGGMLADPFLALVAGLLAALVTAAQYAITRRSRRPHGPALVGCCTLLMLVR